MTLPTRPYLTTRAHGALAEAWRIARDRGAADVAPIDVALGLLHDRQGIAVGMLLMQGVDLDALGRELRAELPDRVVDAEPATEPRWTPELERVVSLAREESCELGVEFYGVEQVLLAVLRDGTGAPARVMARHGVSYEGARGTVQRLYAAQPDS
jgi:ATP-dependent Clp protease ATP-binding subunit ClpA